MRISRYCNANTNAGDMAIPFLINEVCIAMFKFLKIQFVCCDMLIVIPVVSGVAWGHLRSFGLYVCVSLYSNRIIKILRYSYPILFY